jgi:ABC-type sugar transport system substrate-binding protein
VVLLTANAGRPYEAAQIQILQRLISARPGYEFKTLDAAGDAAAQAAQLEQTLAQKPLAVLVTPVSPDTLAAGVAKAAPQGVMVIGLGSRSATLGAPTSLQVDQRALGRMAGEIAAQALLKKAAAEGSKEASGRVVELRIDELPDSDSALRHEGFLEELAKHPGIVLVHDAPGNGTRKGGRERTEEALRLQSRFDVIYAHNDSMALGASTALGDGRQDVMIIGTDGYRGPEGGYSLVNSGELDASIHQPVLVDLALRIIQRRAENADFQPKPVYQLRPSVISPKTLDEIRLKGFPALPEL